MVEVDVGDDAQLRRDEVGRVQPAAHAHLNDGNINLFVSEIIEGHAHSHLEEGEFHCLKLILVSVNELHNIFFWNHLSVDADALAEVAQVRRGVKACLVARFLKNGGQGMRNRAFAVGAGHMYRLEVVLWVV